MNWIFNAVSRLLGQKSNDDNETDELCENQIQNSNYVFSDKDDSINLTDYLKNIKELYENILDYIENKQDDDEVDVENIYNTFNDQEILSDKYKLKLFLNLFCKIADNHNRSSNVIQKIENFLKSIQNEIQNYYTNDQIFNIFKKNKKLLLFLFKEQIIIPNEQIFSFFNNDKNITKNYQYYFYPEFKSFYSEELAKKYKIKSIDLKDFEKKREIGENDYYISQLIRDDLIKEFIIYITKNNISLTSTINSSIFETNNFLIDKKPTFLEYATFFGSIQIFQYIRLNNIELTPSLWLYAIHGKNPEIIHLLEENDVLPSSYKECLLESIKCHHNEIKEYFQINYNDLMNDIDLDITIESIKYFNFLELSENHINNSESFYYLCKYDYCQIVQLLLNIDHNNKIDINLSIEKKINNKKDGYEKYFTNCQSLSLEKRYKETKTSLIGAIENRNVEIVEMLLQQKNINVHEKFKSSYNMFSDGRYLYISGFDSKSVLFIAAEKGYSEIVQLLINRKDIDVNEINKINDGFTSKELTALHIAVTNEQIDIIKILLNAKNINTNCIESDIISHYECYNKTPLNIAIENGNSQIVKLLLSNEKTDVNQEYYFYYHCMVCDAADYDKPGKKLTPLQLAIEKENKEIIKILLETKKININKIGFIRTADIGDPGKKIFGSALHMAIEKNDFDIVQMLLSYDGINVNSVANYKDKFKKEIREYTFLNKINEEKTPLFIAVENENLKIIELLLQNKNIDKNKKLKIIKDEYGDNLRKCKNREKITALDIAIKKGNASIINILK